MEANLKSHLDSLIGESHPVDRRSFIVTSLSAGFALATLPVSAQTIATSADGLVAGEVKVPAKGGVIPAYRAMPAAGSAFPTILVVQEVFGVHEWIKDICRRLAKMGYYAIAPELYARQGDPTKYTDIPSLINEVVKKVPDAQVMEDLDATVAYAKESGKADTGKLGITGFCWGGRITWMYAAHNSKLKAAVAWYGQLGDAFYPGDKTVLDVIPAIKVPVLGLYGADDSGIPLAQVEKVRTAMKAGKKTVEIRVYPATPHGFLADYRPSYRKESAEDGWTRMSAWFKRYLV